ncbi:MAG: class I SAM-dependent rRNA methyltransferase [Burkholderiales bacterium]|nr:class I SAM-dependent rRNA methyltransferase [Burkholderiales bacterium]
MKVPALILKPGREKSLKRRHPWVFSGAVERAEGAPAPGATIVVRASDGQPLGLAAYSPHSQIRARMWSFAAGERIDADWFRQRIAAAVARRAGLDPAAGVRLVHAEADGLPGLIVDRYADLAVVQLLSAGCEHWREAIVAALVEATGVAQVYERSDTDSRELEGLEPRSGPLHGPPPAAPVEIVENGLKLAVDVAHGHKTGFYLDQRNNRARARAAARPGITALNCFCYTGAFSVALAAGGAARVVSIDSSAPALDLARANWAANGLDAAHAEWRCADVFEELRRARDRGEKYDIIVLDPPKFAPTPASVERATRAYKDINLLGLKLLAPGGRLITFSCSGGVSADLFGKIVAGAAADAGVEAIIEARLVAAADHPVLLSFPEGEYLKGLVLRRI